MMKQRYSAVLSALVFLMLTLPVSAKDNKADKKDRKRVKEWYLSTLVTARDPATGVDYVAANPSIIGKLKESSDRKDRHDVPPFQSPLGRRAGSVFLQQDWGEDSGEYLTDYRSSDGNREVWTFTVGSSIPGAQVTLNWDGLYALTPEVVGADIRYQQKLNTTTKTLRKLHLIDLKSYEVVDAITDGALNNYSFTLEEGESTRDFRWVLGPVKSRHFEQTRKPPQQRTHAKKAPSTPPR